MGSNFLPDRGLVYVDTSAVFTSVGVVEEWVGSNDSSSKLKRLVDFNGMIVFTI